MYVELNVNEQHQRQSINYSFIQGIGHLEVPLMFKLDNRFSVIYIYMSVLYCVMRSYTKADIAASVYRDSSDMYSKLA